MKLWELSGAIFTLIAGTLLHFTYAWFGKNNIVGIFSAVNESTWEHLKLLFWPMLLFSAVEYAVIGKQYANFIPVKALSMLIGVASIVVLFYTYSGSLGTHYLVADIGTFVVSVVAAYYLSSHLLQTDLFSSPRANLNGWLGLLAMVACFVMFTASPPTLGLFLDPVTNRYGK